MINETHWAETRVEKGQRCNRSVSYIRKRVDETGRRCPGWETFVGTALAVPGSIEVPKNYRDRKGCVRRGVSELTQDTSPNKPTNVIHGRQSNLEPVEPLLKFTMESHGVGVGGGGRARPVRTEDLDWAVSAREEYTKQYAEMSRVVDHPDAPRGPSRSEEGDLTAYHTCPGIAVSTRTDRALGRAGVCSTAST